MSRPLKKQTKKKHVNILSAVCGHKHTKQTTSSLFRTNTLVFSFLSFLQLGIRPLLQLLTDRKLHKVNERNDCQKPQTAQRWCNEITAKRRMLPHLLADWHWCNGRRTSPGGRHLPADCQIREWRTHGAEIPAAKKCDSDWSNY